MGSEKKLDHDHDHGHVPSCYTPPKLALLVSRTSIPPEAPTPPPRTMVSVPFQWEEAPGKPRPFHTRSEPKGSDIARTLELPPRLLFLETKVSSNLPSPTTVLDGPYIGRAISFTSSYRSPKDTWNANFGSSRWSGLKKNNREDPEGSFDFSSCTVDGTSKVKITRVRKRGSFLSLSQARLYICGQAFMKALSKWSHGSARARKAEKMAT